MRPAIVLLGEARTGWRVGDLPGRLAKIAVRFYASSLMALLSFGRPTLLLPGEDWTEGGRLARPAGWRKFPPGFRLQV